MVLWFGVISSAYEILVVLSPETASWCYITRMVALFFFFFSASHGSVGESQDDRQCMLHNVENK